mmetsp:Transcript_48656/g.155449  ORF Transcript_48656/g.155449 Transcript_48656/m.155449 type:complete len:219 (-) Transcript_48656:306-962(-)
MMFGCFTNCRGQESETEDVLESTKGSDVWLRLATEERRYKQEEEEHRKELKRRTAEAEKLRQAEDEARQQTQDTAQKLKGAQRLFKEGQARYEQLKRERELAEHTGLAREAEGKRLLEERERWVRKTAVIAFLKEHGFAAVNTPKKFMMKTTFALHVAAEAGNAKMVAMLLKEGADPGMRNSQGKTALQMARIKDVDDSHAEVISAFTLSSTARAGGA